MARPYAKHQTVSRPDAQSDVHTSYHDKRRKPFVILKKTKVFRKSFIRRLLCSSNADIRNKKIDQPRSLRDKYLD